MSDGPAMPSSGSPGQGYQPTRLESVDEIRRLIANERTPTRIESVPAPPPSAAPPRDATRIESVAEIRRLIEQEQSREQLPAGAAKSVSHPGTERFRPARRPPMALLTVCDDGQTTGQEIRLRDDRTIIGRSEGDVQVPYESMMSVRHAEIVRETVDGRWRWFLVDLGSTNGTFARTASTALRHGAEFMIGSAVIRFEDAALNVSETTSSNSALPTKTQSWQSLKMTDLKASLLEIRPDGAGQRFFLDDKEHDLGREASPGMMTLSNDATIDLRHAKVSKDSRGVWWLADTGSLNGVWVKVTRHPLEGTCEFQLGEQRFRVQAPG